MLELALMTVAGDPTLKTVGASAQKASPVQSGGSDIEVDLYAVQALRGNSGTVYIAESAANAAAEKGFELGPGDLVYWPGHADLYVHGSTSGDKVLVRGLVRRA